MFFENVGREHLVYMSVIFSFEGGGCTKSQWLSGKLGQKTGSQIANIGFDHFTKPQIHKNINVQVLGGHTFNLFVTESNICMELSRIFVWSFCK